MLRVCAKAPTVLILLRNALGKQFQPHHQTADLLVLQSTLFSNVRVQSNEQSVQSNLPTRYQKKHERTRFLALKSPMFTVSLKFFIILYTD